MELKTNAVLIFKNDRKTGDTHPDYKGEIDVNGQRFDIALWVKQGTKSKYFAGKISEPWKKAEPPQSDLTKEQVDMIDDTPGNDLPF